MANATMISDYPSKSICFSISHDSVGSSKLGLTPTHMPAFTHLCISSDPSRHAQNALSVLNGMSFGAEVERKLGNCSQHHNQHQWLHQAPVWPSGH